MRKFENLKQIGLKLTYQEVFYKETKIFMLFLNLVLFYLVLLVYSENKQIGRV